MQQVGKPVCSIIAGGGNRFDVRMLHQHDLPQIDLFVEQGSYLYDPLSRFGKLCEPSSDNVIETLWNAIAAFGIREELHRAITPNIAADQRHADLFHE